MTENNNSQGKQQNWVEGETQNKSQKTEDTRIQNIRAAIAIADLMKTSLGPKGMDKLIETKKGELIVTNDGATILKNLQVFHPAAKLLIQTSKAQDIEAGDGTTSVVVLSGALLEAAQSLLEYGIHPTRISDGFALALKQALEVINGVGINVDLQDEEQLLQCVKTSLSSKIISQNSTELAPIALEAVKSICDIKTASNLDLKNIKMHQKLGGTLEDIQLFKGVVFTDKMPISAPGSVNKVANPKIALLQFCISSPKTNMENNVVISDYAQIDQILKEERLYIMKIVKQIVKSGANVVLIQKSILRDAVNDLAIHYLTKNKIMVIKDIERTDVPFICQTLGCIPVAHVENLTSEKLSTKATIAQTVILSDGSKVFHIDVENPTTSNILIWGSSHLVMEEAERSLHDALCVLWSLVKNRKLVAGGGAIEIEVSKQLENFAQTQRDIMGKVIEKYSEALEVIPYILASNCGLNPIKIVTEIRTKHQHGLKYSGLKARTGQLVDNCLEHKIMQPALVSISALTLATEVTWMILKIDDVVASR